MTNYDSPFSDLGVDALNGAYLMNEIGIDAYALQDPTKQRRLYDIFQYLQKIPNQAEFISRAIRGKNVDKIDHLWGYVNLHTQKEQLASKIKTIEEEIGYYER